ncbi:glycosyltransferase family 2 protein [Flavobacterium agrisoli]|uniref:Glycosyltransferase family 2 protein n=1 Tax=Flavobacterium agrisoli TaxID=2793066 RepID=A0A934PL76_9FLAO|nr:glycosyltransferase family 2 protein [Flavobacterium agrisoli]MBK0368795.1 glycosyltransferase family 2 protein [Flavobacterium agrisoli]
MLNITTIILTYNEEKHIERCVKNALEFSKEIFVVDSFSTDTTVEIAEHLGAKVFQHKWENNYAKQFNWGLQNLPITTRWVVRLDADEYFTHELIEEVKVKLPKLAPQVSGIILNRKQYCFGAWVHPLKLLRIFEYGKGSCEQRWMDEHIIISDGQTIEFQHQFLDYNLNNFGWWIEKHNGYSIREAIDLLDVELNLSNKVVATQNMGAEAIKKRGNKLRYARSPLFLRSFLYFMYRYLFKLGFLKGKGFFLWDFFQGWWYRTLVDVKIYEIKKACGKSPQKIKAFIKSNYKIDIENV